ncbi:hypothetical protein [Nitratireductor sp. GCM10026969]|uniref:hypothetical protein n=1 Tax=Nitratireductor sp. GCM10026969 TaxID=3252645 RepID=UPI00361F17E9
MEDVMWMDFSRRRGILAVLLSFAIAILFLARPADASECTVDEAARPIAKAIVEILEAPNNEVRTNATLEGCTLRREQLILKYHCVVPRKTKLRVEEIYLESNYDVSARPVSGRNTVWFL